MVWHLNPSLQRIYVDEVRYLHSLWHSSPKSNPSSSRTGTAVANSTPILRPHNPATASKKKKRKRKEMESNSLKNDVEWPVCPSPPPRPLDVTWEEAAAASSPPLPPPVPSPEDLSRWAAIDLQRKAAKSCVEFFKRRHSSTADGGEDSKLEDEADEEEDEEEDENYDSSAAEKEAFLFFILLFKKNNELLRYFEQNWEKGWFCCLVCEAIAVLGNRKRVKNYSGCLGLLQHSHGVLKTTRKTAHRAFGRAICKVMGWDASRLPSIVLDSAMPTGKVLRKPEEYVVASNGDGETCKGESSRMKVVRSLEEADEST